MLETLRAVVADVRSRRKVRINLNRATRATYRECRECYDFGCAIVDHEVDAADAAARGQRAAAAMYWQRAAHVRGSLDNHRLLEHPQERAHANTA